jgi:predicted permease
VRPALLMVAAAVALVLLLVCANLATLYVGRTIDAEQQTALRAALGAGSWARAEVRLLETLLVSAAGGAAGIALSGAMVGAMLAVAPARLPRADEVGVDGRALAFSFGLTLLVGVLVALFPLLRERGVDAAAVLRAGTRSIGGSSRRAQRALVVVQVVVAGSLLVSASLIGRSLGELWRVDPGFRVDGVLLATARAPRHLIDSDREAMALLEQARGRIAGEPSVRGAGFVDFLPLSTGGDQNGFSFAGSPGSSGRPEDDDVVADHFSAGPGYFDAAGIEIIEGRPFTPEDRADGARVFIIDEGLARRFWPSGGAVGGTLRYFNEEGEARIVGVARHARRYDLRADGRAQIYSPLAQRPVRVLQLAVHVGDEPLSGVGALRAAFRDTDARIAVDDVRTMHTRVGEALSAWRFMLQLLGAFAVTALFLTSLGVYGVVAVSVARRQSEIGLRMALGARRADVARAVVGQAMRLVGAGLLLSLIAGAALTRLLSGFLFGVGPVDPASFVTAAAALLMVAVVASWRPARRAARLSPMQTLRGE